MADIIPSPKAPLSLGKQNINAEFNRLKGVDESQQAQINAEEAARAAADAAHAASETAHPAEHVTYTGAVTGAGDAKAAIDNLQTQVNTLVVNGDSSAAAAQAAVDETGYDHGNLKVRLDTQHTQVVAQLAETAADVAELDSVKANKTEVNALATGKADKTALDATNAVVAQKAAQADLDGEIQTRQNDTAALNARMDTFVAAGSSSDNAETLDIRAGADGRAYSSAGTAVRQQFANVIKSQVGQTNGITFVQGSLNGVGAEVSSTSRVRSLEYFRAANGFNIRAIDGYMFSVYIYSFADVSGFVSATSFVSEYTVTGDCYIRIVARNQFNTDFSDVSAVKAAIVTNFTSFTRQYDSNRNASNIGTINLSKYTDLDMEQRSYSYLNGAFDGSFVPVTSTTRLKMVDWRQCSPLTDTCFDYIESSAGYEFAVLFRNTALSQIGFLNQQFDKSFILTASATFFTRLYYSWLHDFIANIDSYEYCVIVRKTDNGSITPAEASNLKIVKSLNNQAPMPIWFLLSRDKINNSGNYESTTDFTYLSIKDKLRCVVGERYRIRVPNNYMVSTFVNGVLVTYHQRMIDIVADQTLMPIVFRKADFSTIDNIYAINITIEHVRRKNQTEYDFILAAADSSAADKLKADLVCDGVNDEIELNCACNCNLTVSKYANVLLLPGTYHIDNFLNYKNNGYHYGIIVLNSANSGGQYSVRISGINKDHREMTSATKIVVSSTAHAQITAEEEFSIIGAIRFGSVNMGIFNNMYNLDIKNLFIELYGIDKPLVGVDGAGFSQLGVENVTVMAKVAGTMILPIKFDLHQPIKGVTGIRGVCGSNRGKGNYIKSCLLANMHEALALTGEHFIVEDTLMYSSIYGFTVGNYPVQPVMEHPNVFIGCSVEKCVNFGLLTRYGETVEFVNAGEPMQSITYIGGSTEPAYELSDGSFGNTNPIKEIIKGAYSGIFQTDWRKDTPIFLSDGSGKNIEARNTLHLEKGSSSQRGHILGRQEGSRYYDTDLGKPLFVHNGTWVDAAGNPTS